MALGQDLHVTDEMLHTIQSFTCSMYCLNTTAKEFNTLRYEMFRAKKCDFSSGQLPPCKDSLEQHRYRANYQTAIWRKGLQNS